MMTSAKPKGIWNFSGTTLENTLEIPPQAANGSLELDLRWEGDILCEDTQGNVASQEPKAYGNI